jgi:hypothetical protein
VGGKEMNEQELDAIKARCDKATPGPWVVGDGSPERLYLGADAVMCDVRGVVCQRSVYNGKSEYDKQTYADMEFIAAARQDIPALLDEVERLSSALYDMYEDECALEALEMAHESKILCMQKEVKCLTCERDAAIEDLKISDECEHCYLCKNFSFDMEECEPCRSCIPDEYAEGYDGYEHYEKWEWRGVREVQD